MQQNNRGMLQCNKFFADVGNIHTFLDPCYSSKDRYKLRALLYLRMPFVSGTLPSDSSLVHWVRWLAKWLVYDDCGDRGGTIWRVENILKLKVLEQPSDMLVVLRELHDGFGHRALPAVYHHFRLRYWVLVAAKVIKQYINGFSSRQRLAAPNKYEVPGYQIQPADIFSHWSVDDIGPFPANPCTSDLHVTIDVDGLPCWAEAKAVNNTDADTCSEFLYSEICWCYGVPESFRTNHWGSFDNDIVLNLPQLLHINHHMSTPYYTGSNDMIESLVQTFQVALRRTIQHQLTGALGVNDEPSPYWSHLVPFTLFTYPTSAYSALGVSPAKVMFGCRLHLPEGNALLPSSPLPPHDHKEAIFQRVRFIMDVVPTLCAQLPPWANLVLNRLFNVGDSVWVRDSKSYTSFPPVFTPRRKGPFIIKNCLNRNLYCLRTDLALSGKRSIALALPISGS